MESLARTERLSRQQVMLLSHRLTARVNYRLFSTLGLPNPNNPSKLLFFYFLLSSNAERGTCNRYVVDAIYSGAKGAQLVNDPSVGALWVVDCDAEINVTFKIGGQSYPVHPLDVTRQVVEPTGETLCYGTVRVVSSQSFVC